MLGLFGPSAAASSALESPSLLAPDDPVTAPPSGGASVSLFAGDVAHTCSIVPHPAGAAAVELQAQRIRARAGRCADNVVAPCCPHAARVRRAPFRRRRHHRS